MKRFSLRLTEAEYLKLKIYCEEINISMNDKIRELVRDWSPNNKKLCEACKKQGLNNR